MKLQKSLTEDDLKMDSSKGAIPKRPRTRPPETASNEDLSRLASVDRSRFHRRALRRRPPTPPASNGHTEMLYIPSEKLRQRILEILSTASNEECSKEIDKLKKELEISNEQEEQEVSSTPVPEESVNTSKIFFINSHLFIIKNIFKVRNELVEKDVEIQTLKCQPPQTKKGVGDVQPDAQNVSDA